MNQIVNTFLLKRDKFMPEMYLRQPGFTYSSYIPSTKNKERIQKIYKESVNSRYIHQNELDKACFKHHMVYGDFRYLPRRTASDKELHDKALNIAKTPKYNEYQRGLSSIVYKVLDKISSGLAAARAP